MPFDHSMDTNQGGPGTGGGGPPGYPGAGSGYPPYSSGGQRPCPGRQGFNSGGQGYNSSGQGYNPGGQRYNPGGRGPGGQGCNPGGRGPGGQVQAWNLQLNARQLTASAAAGLVFWLPCEAVCRAFSGPLMIGAVFALFALWTALVVLVLSRLTDTAVKPPFPWLFPLVPLLLLGLFLFGTLFQWVYSLDTDLLPSQPTSYLFLIDDSGSMGWNDPEGKRFEAVNRVLSGKGEDFPYAVYSFANFPETIRKMAPRSEGAVDYTGSSDGGTDIPAALDYVLQDLRQSDGTEGDFPKVILLTDGRIEVEDVSAAERRVETLLREYCGAGISVSTVGLGSETDQALLQRIADSTGGVFVSVDQADQLNQAFGTAVARSAERTLISHRTVGRVPVYGTMRVLFLLLLGLMAQAAVVFAYGGPDSAAPAVFVSLIPTALGAVLMEVLSHFCPDAPVRLLMWVLFALTIVQEQKRRRSYTPGPGVLPRNRTSMG